MLRPTTSRAFGAAFGIGFSWTTQLDWPRKLCGGRERPGRRTVVFWLGPGFDVDRGPDDEGVVCRVADHAVVELDHDRRFHPRAGVGAAAVGIQVDIGEHLRRRVAP